MDLAVVVDDSHAFYPIRIDPTFSDANISMGGFPRANSRVYAAASDGTNTDDISGIFPADGRAVGSTMRAKLSQV